MSGYTPSILLKPTHMCNFNCSYCYDADLRKRYGNMIMSMETVKQIGKLISDYRPQIVFHGGEPLMAGKEWYRQCFEALRPYKANIKYEMQSNGSMLDGEWLDLLSGHDVSVGISYDFSAQETQRGNSDVSRQFGLFKSRGLDIGCICVVTKNNIGGLWEIFERSAEVLSGHSIAFNLLFRSNQSELTETGMLTLDELVGGYGSFLDCYLYMNHGSRSERTAESFLSFLFGKGVKLCTYTDCRRTWIGISPDGTLYPCDRYYPDEYILGNVYDFAAMRDVSRTNAYKRFYKDIQRRFNDHCALCHFFPVCAGGCNGTHVTLTGRLDGVGNTVCEQFYGLSAIVYDRMRTADLFGGYFNTRIAKQIYSGGGITLNEIYSFLASIGYAYPLQYDGPGTGFTDSLEYRIFRLFNPFNAPNGNLRQEPDFSRVRAYPHRRQAYIRERYDERAEEIDDLLMKNKLWALHNHVNTEGGSVI